ncbi:MAG TPA: ROK family protein [Gemmatimonadaceae bacterium]|nr:ROK family protein [Gemmatimonadaceae bacterium]
MRKIDTRSFVRATRSTPRAINRQIVLNLVRDHQPISRAELARRMKVGRGLVTSLVGELLDEGAIYEGPTADAPRGRRPTMLFVRTHDRLVVAIDVRFSLTYVMLGDLGGTRIALESFPTITDPATLVSELAARVRRLLAEHGARGTCEGIGLVMPGMVDQRNGRVLNAPQLGWRDVDVRDPLATATGLPVSIESASIACALAQLWLGDGGSERVGERPGDFVYVTVSDGVGAAIVVDGEVVRGASHTAGEFGHVPLALDGPRCLCGARGCLEAYTSNLATLSRFLGREPSAATSRSLRRGAGPTIEDVIVRAGAGDAAAQRAVDETARCLGVGLAIMVNALNPARIYVGGEITGLWDRIAPTIRAAVAERALTAAAAATPIVPEPGDGHPRLRGAMALVAAPQFAAPRLA